MSERKIFAEEIHKRATKKFTRRKVTVHRMVETWGLDLAQMTESGGDKFFSKFAWCVPMKNKSASTVLTALKEVVEKSGRMAGGSGIRIFTTNISRRGPRVTIS